MADLDQLQIKIESNATPAADAIDKLIHSFERLNSQLNNLDVGKVTKFANAINKISNTNASVQATNKGLSELSKHIDSAFGIKKKQGITQIKDAITDLYEAQKAFLASDGNIQLGDNLEKAKSSLAGTIKEFYQLKTSVDETSKSVREYVKQTADAGTKINVSAMKEEFGEDFKEMMSQLGKFKKAFSTSEGSDFESYISEMKSVLGENVFADKPEQAFKQLIEYVSGAKDEYLGFNDAVKQGAVSEKDVNNEISQLLEKMERLSQYAESMSNVPGVTSIADALAKLGNVVPPDLKTLLQSTKQAQEVASQVPKEFEKISEAADKASSSVSNLEDDIEEVASASQDTSNKTTAVVNNVAENTKEYKKELEKPVKEEGSVSVLANLMALSHELEEISGKFEKLANIGKGALKLMVKPLQLAAEEYVEKFEGIKKSFDGFKSHIQKNLTKLSAFWKRTMKTFTFMLVRKAITAIIKEVNNAIQSMAKFSDAMGTQFNNSISTLVADFQYLGRSIVSVFAPLINFIAPIIDAIVDKIALLLSYIGMLMAALTGASSFTKAKKNVGNYAQSLDEASKSAKNLTMGIDELNILAENTGGGAGAADGWEDAWEEVEIPDWINDLAKKIKDIFKDLFEPIKKAWDKAKAYVLAGWNYMCREMSLLLKAIWDDFIEVWKSDTMVDVFYKLFLILGDIEYTIGNIARKFRLAWKEGKKGLKIFQNLAEILDILVNHVRNVTLYMTAWSDQLDFNPLLESIVNLTEALKGLADFLGGVFEDVMENVVLKYIKFLIEEGLPHLNNTIAEIMNAFDFEKIRNDLKPLEEAFERLLENLDIGKTNAIGNLGKQFAEFTNSQEFTDFLQRLADIMDLISAEDVEKILTGIGEGILRVADGLVKFVNSDLFMDFLTKIDEWLANASSEDIADLFEKLAIAIGLFEFSAFAMDKIAGFLEFMSIISAAQNLGEIAAGMNGVAAGSEAIGASAAGLGTVAVVLAAIVLVVTSLVESFGGLQGLMAELSKRANELSSHLSKLAEKFKINDKLNSLKESFLKLKEALGGFKDVWMLVFDYLETKAKVVIGVITGYISGFIIIVSGMIQQFTGILEIISGAITGIKGVLTLDPELMLEGWKKMFEGIKDIALGFVTIIDGIITQIVGVLDGAFSAIFDDVPLMEVYEKFKALLVQCLADVVAFFAEIGSKVVEFFVNLSTKFDEIVVWIQEKLAEAIETFRQWGEDIVTWATETIPQIVDDIAEFFGDLKDKIKTKLSYAIDSFNDWKTKAKEWITTNIPQIIEDFVGWFASIPDKLKALGTDIIDGLIGGVKEAWDKVKEGAGAIKTVCDEFVQKFKDGFGIASPSKEAQTIGEFFIEGLILPLQEDASWMDTTIVTFCTMLVQKFKEILSPDIFSAIGQQIILGLQTGLEHSNADVVVISFAQRFIMLFQTYLGPEQFATLGNLIVTSISESMIQALPLLQGVIERIGTTIMNAIVEFGNLLGTTLTGTMLPAFIETYIMPYFTMEMWQPLLNQLLEQVLIPAFDEFTVWFDETMRIWWDENLLYWFSDDKWNEDIFRPLKECIQEHWETFSSWWDSTMLAWWNNQVIPWFEKTRWKEQFDHILEVAKEVFKLVKEAIQDQMNEAKLIVEEACASMRESLQSVLEIIGTIMSEIGSLTSIGGAIQIQVGGFASGGYPTQGSLFLAGESGAELIGTIGGKTAVASNDEITGIRDAVYATGNEESQLLAQLINIGRAMLDKDPVIIGDKDIARMANNGQSQLGMSIIR